MTTGRINQVTILKAEPGGRHTAHAQQSWLLIGHRWQKTEVPATSDTAASSREPRLPPRVYDHPIAPTEFPKRRSTLQAFQRTRRPEVTHTPLRRRTPFPSHVRDGYQVRLTPKCL